MSSRAAFMDRIRAALRSSRSTAVADAPSRGGVGYQGGGSDPIVTFRDGLVAAGGNFHHARDVAEATAIISALLDRLTPCRALLGKGRVIDQLALAERLTARGIEVTEPDADRDALFAADIAITGVGLLIAETGTVVVRATRDEPGSLSLLAPAHIAVADASQITPDLFDLFEPGESQELPSCLTLITGPSKTGDIELKLVTGVHGPGELHVVLIAGRLV